MKWFTTSATPATRAPSGRTGPHAREATESIRAALIHAVSEVQGGGSRQLLQRIHYAGDAERLWYLRPEAMSVLAATLGEARAREALVEITALFRDVLPEGLASPLRAAQSPPSAGPMRRANPKETS